MYFSKLFFLKQAHSSNHTLTEVFTLDNFQTAVHRSFAVADNLGEVSAKAQVLFMFHLCFPFFKVYVVFDGINDYYFACFRFNKSALTTLVLC